MVALAALTGGIYLTLELVGKIREMMHATGWGKGDSGVVRALRLVAIMSYRIEFPAQLVHVRVVQTPLDSTPAPVSDAPPPSPAPERRPRWRELIGPALFEATFVVLGVILALAANEWREARQHRAEGAGARSAIANELRENRRLLDSSRTYHRHLMQGIYGAPPSAPVQVTLFDRGFIMPAQVSTTAWEVASETGALAHIPYEEVLAISQVIALERRYDAMAVSTGQLLYSELYRLGPQGVTGNARNLASIIAAFSYREDQVIARIDSTLALFSR